MPTPRYATIAAMYGDEKPDCLTALLASIQDMLRSRILQFVPRPLHDIHSTIIGLESSGTTSARPAELDGVDVAKICRELVQLLRDRRPTIQFGGFAEGEYRLLSRGRSLYDRMLVTSGNKIVLIGWPVDAAGRPTSELDLIRRNLERYGAHHRYHDTPDAVDPDSYMVIGELLPGWDTAKLATSIAECRDTLLHHPCIAHFTPERAYLITYVDTKLPAESSTSVALADFTGR